MSKKRGQPPDDPSSAPESGTVRDTTSGNQPAKDRPAKDRRRSSPQTDPTNPVTQESTGELTAPQRASERREAEPGLTDRDREERGPTY
jgi:hypothetical protein